MAEPYPPPPRAKGRFALLALLAGSAAFALYFLACGSAPFPGPPAAALGSHLGCDPLAPALLDPLWSAVVRALDAVFPARLAFAVNLFSAGCAALALALFALVVSFLSYDISVPDPKGVLARREMWARAVFALASVLYLAATVPFFVAATRSLPAAFHELLFMAVLLAFAGAYRSQRVLPSLAAGLFAGAASVEFASVYVLSLLLPLAFARQRLFAFSEEESPRVLARTFAFLTGFAAGWAAALWGAVAYRGTAGAGTEELARAAFEYLTAQASRFAELRFSPGLVLLFALAIVPAVYVFLVSHRSPGLATRGGIFARVVLLAVLGAVLFNSLASPWRYLEMYCFLVTPYVLMALAAGEIAGAFFLMASQAFSSWDRPSRFWRPLSRVASFLVLGVFAAAAFCNFPLGRSTDGEEAHEAAEAILSALRESGRDVLIASGVVDDQLLLLRHEEERLLGSAAPPPFHAISLSRLGSPDYVTHLLAGFSGDPDGPPSTDPNAFGVFLEGFLRSESGRARVATSDFETGVRGYGFLLPRGDTILLAASRAPEDWDALLPHLRRTWDFWRAAAENPPAENALAHNIHEYFLRTASKNANDAGVLLAGDGRVAEAAEAFRAAEAIRGDNVAAAFNLVSLADRPGGEALGLDRDEALARAEELARDAPVGDLYACASRHGYLLSAHPDGKRRIWMYTGLARDAENVSRTRKDAGELERATHLNRLVRGAHYDDPESFLPSQLHFQRLMRASDVVGALVRLARLAIASGATEEAGDYLAEARLHGASERELALDKALLAYARGEKARAAKALARLTRVSSGGLRAWLALATIAPTDSRTYRTAMEKVDGLETRSTALLEAAANLRVLHGEYDEARKTLDRWLELEPHSLPAWEILVDVDDLSQEDARLDEHLALLLRFAPDHPYRFVKLGNEAAANGDWENAEWAWRRAVQEGRKSTLLARLGNVLLLRGGEERVREALALADEILERVPDHVAGRLLRAKACVAAGRYEEAAEELAVFLSVQPESPAGRLLRARCRFETGDFGGAVEDVKFLSPRKKQLDKREVRALRLLREELVARLKALRAARENAA